MKKNGFTMIELVFIIAVLGILAGVALPRLAATRDEAAYTAAIQNLDILANDITNFYMSQGPENFSILPYQGVTTPWDQNMRGWYKPVDISGMTNVPLRQDSKYPAYFDFYVGGKPCIKIAVNIMDLQRAYPGSVTVVDRDLVLLKFDKRPYQNQKLSIACQKVMKSELFSRFDAEKKRFLNIRMVNAKGDTLSRVYPTGGTLIGSASLFGKQYELHFSDDDSIVQQYGATGDIVQ